MKKSFLALIALSAIALSSAVAASPVLSFERAAPSVQSTIQTAAAPMAAAKIVTAAADQVAFHELTSPAVAPTPAPAPALVSVRKVGGDEATFAKGPGEGGEDESHGSLRS